MKKCLRIKPSFVAYLLLISYLNPHEIFYPFLAAAILHELSHAAVLRLMGKEIKGLTLSFAEAEMKTEPLPASALFFSAAAGPAVNLLCAVVFKRTFSGFAAISFLLAIYNLLPVCHLDGGRMLAALLSLLLPQHTAENICTVISVTVQLAVAAAVVYGAAFCNVGIYPLILFCFLCFKAVLRRKTSCFSAAETVK